MQQYDQDTLPISIKAHDSHQDLDSLRHEIVRQQRRIDSLEAQIRRLKNDLRTAINSFNSSHG